MTNVGFATLDVIPSFKGFAGHLERGTTPGLLAAGRSGGTKFGDVAGRSAGARFGSVFKSAAKVGILGGLAAAAGAIKLGADAIGEAREAQKVARQTRAVIKSTGGAAKVSAKDVGRLATNLSKMAGIDDEVVQGGENILLTFKNIRNEQGKGNKVFDKATRAALDMSVALGKDLNSSATLVGKALNDPVAGMSALSRAGVQFTADQKDQIKTLVESGDQLGAQKIILKELTGEFAGSAKSQASSSDRLKVAFDNVKESLGTALLPVMQDFSRFLLRKGIPAAQEFVDWFTKDGIPAIKDLGRKLRPLAENLLPAAADAFKSVRDFAEDALPFAEGIVKSFNDMPPWVKKVLIGGAVGGLAVKKFGIDITGGLLKRGNTPLNPLFVSDVSNGGGLGGKTKLGGLLGAAGTAGLISAIAGGVTLGVGKVLDKSGDASLLGAGSGGSGSVGGPTGDFFSGLNEDNGNGPKKKLEEFNRTLKQTQGEWLLSKDAAADYAKFIQNKVPKEFHSVFHLLGIDVANQQINGMFDTFIARNNRLQAQFSGSDAGSTQPPNHSPGRGTPATSGRSVTVNNTYNLNTIKDAEAQNLHKQQQIGMGGFG